MGHGNGVIVTFIYIIPENLRAQQGIGRSQSPSLLQTLCVISNGKSSNPFVSSQANEHVEANKLPFVQLIFPSDGGLRDGQNISVNKIKVYY